MHAKNVFVCLLLMHDNFW